MLYFIAGLYVEYEPEFERLKKRSEKYLAENQNLNADIKIKISEEMMAAHIKKYGVTENLAEYVLMGAEFYREILEHSRFFLHSSAVCVNGNGYAFTGPCGAGKSTHSAMWRKHFGDELIAVNDDKPVILIKDGKPFVCGTPFSGKHDINTNTIVPLKGVCVLSQSAENSIEKLKASEAFPVILEQTLRPDEAGKMMKLMDLIDTMLSQVGVYKLNCNISSDAVELAFNTMNS